MRLRHAHDDKIGYKEDAALGQQQGGGGGEDVEEDGQCSVSEEVEAIGFDKKTANMIRGGITRKE